MKKLFLISLMIVVVGALFFGSCAKQAPAPAPAPAPTPTPAPAPAPAPAPVEPIKLRFTHPVPLESVHHRAVFVPWAEMIKERTTAIGKPVEITIFGAQALGKLQDQYDLVVKGVADICGNVGTESLAGRFPLNDVMDLPFMFTSATDASLTAQELFDTHPEFAKELSQTKLLFFQPTAPKHINSRTKQIKTLEDFKGIKVNSVGGLDVRTIKALGASPVTLMMPEVYAALERGALDVGVLEWEGTFAFKWHEVTKYRTAFPKGLYITHIICSMNWDTWNRLPPEVQKIFEELSGTYMSKFAGEAFDEANTHLFDVIMERDKKVGNPEPYYVPENEFQRWVKAATPVYEQWIADVEAKGLPARALFEDTQRLAKKYSE